MNTNRFLPLVHSIASRIKQDLNLEIPLEELIRIGSEGLSKAADEFQTRHGTTFRVFAHYHIRAAIYGSLMQSEKPATREHVALHSTINELMRFYSNSAESTVKRSVHAEVEELRRLIQCLVPIWLLWKDAKGELEGNAKQALNAALTELEEQEKKFLESHYFKKNPGKASTSRAHWRILEKIRVSLQEKLHPGDLRL